MISSSDDDHLDTLSESDDGQIPESAPPTMASFEDAGVAEQGDEEEDVEMDGDPSTDARDDAGEEVADDDGGASVDAKEETGETTMDVSSPPPATRPAPRTVKAKGKAILKSLGTARRDTMLKRARRHQRIRAWGPLQNFRRPRSRDLLLRAGAIFQQAKCRDATAYIMDALTR